MLPLNSFHAIAAARGDGLRPEFLVLMERIAAESAVADIALRRGDAQIQAGPNPSGAIGTALPEGVVRFPSATHNTIPESGATPAKRII
jgi:hypothetical protein